MAITFRGSATGTVANGGTVSINLTGISGLAQNDIVIAFGLGSSGTSANPSGYTAIHDAAVTGLNARLSYKIMTASPDTSISFWDTGTNAHSGTGIALAFTGVDTSTPQDVATVEVATSDNTSRHPSAITPTSDNCCVVVLSAAGGNGLDTAPGSITSYATTVTTSSDDDNDTVCAGTYRILTGGGGSPESPANWDAWLGTNITGSCSYTLALRPAAEGQPAVKRMGGVRFGGDRRSGGGFSSLWRTGLILPWRTRLVYG